MAAAKPKATGSKAQPASVKKPAGGTPGKTMAGGKGKGKSC
jgi:hypothetical protein